MRILFQEPIPQKVDFWHQVYKFFDAFGLPRGSLKNPWGPPKSFLGSVFQPKVFKNALQDPLSQFHRDLWELPGDPRAPGTDSGAILARFW